MLDHRRPLLQIRGDGDLGDGQTDSAMLDEDVDVPDGEPCEVEAPRGGEQGRQAFHAGLDQRQQDRFQQAAQDEEEEEGTHDDGEEEPSQQAAEEGHGWPRGLLRLGSTAGLPSRQGWNKRLDCTPSGPWH